MTLGESSKVWLLEVCSLSPEETRSLAHWLPVAAYQDRNRAYEVCYELDSEGIYTYKVEEVNFFQPLNGH